MLSDGVDNELDYAFTKYCERKHKAWDLDFTLKPIPTTPRTMVQIKAWMGTQIYGSDSYYMIRQENDTLLKTAAAAIEGTVFKKLGID